MASPTWHSSATLNTWCTLPNSNLNSSGVMHSSESRWVIEAWGGAVVCWGGLYIGSTFTTGTFLVIWGGGHTNYDGNEVYAYGPLESNSPVWQRLRDATSPAIEDVDYDGSDNPVSRHTYSTITYVNDGTRNWLVSIGTIGRYNDAYGGGEVFVYNFNQVSPNSNQPWSRKTAGTYAGDGVVYEPSSAKIWYHPADQHRTASYSVTGDTHAYSGIYQNDMIGYGGNGAAAIDTALGIIAYWDNRYGISFYRTNNGVSNDYYTPSTTGTAPADGNGSIIYDPVAGVFIVRLDADGKKIWTLTPPGSSPYEGGNAWTWTSSTPGTGDTPDAGNTNGTYGRFGYSPNADVVGYILLNHYDNNIYFYKSGASVAGGVTGTLSATLDGATIAAQGTTTVVGSSAVTLAGVTLAAQGTTTVLGALAVTLGGATLAASGAVGGDADGSLAVTLAGVSLAAQGATTIVGTTSTTLGGVSLSGQGTTTIKGSLAATLGGAALEAYGISGEAPAVTAVHSRTGIGIGVGIGLCIAFFLVPRDF